MPRSGSGASELRRFRLLALLGGSVVLLGAILLGPWLSLDIRSLVSGLGLAVAGLMATISGGIKAWVETHQRERRAWLVLTLAGGILITGNAWVAATGADPLTAPSTFSNVTIAVALVLSVVALTMMPHARQRGSELTVMLLDGVTAGGAFLLIAFVLVYTKLVNATHDGPATDRAFALLFPALDVLLATMAVLLVVRSSRADRFKLGLVGSAFLFYAASDMAFAVRMAKGTFHFGSELDLGWIAGYVVLGIAAWAPSRSASETSESYVVAGDVLGTVLVFVTVAAATLVQILLGRDGTLERARTVLWVLTFTAAGLRQTLLTFDNAALRKGLQRRVQEQTAHLIALARQNEMLITSVGDGVYGVDADGVITFVNPAGAAALGYRMDQLVGREAHALLHEPASTDTAHGWTDCYIRHAIELGARTGSADDRYVGHQGLTLPVEITAAPLMNGDSVDGAVVVFRDVTQRREVDRMRSEFMSVVNHELRTPLTSVHGSLTLLAGGRVGDLPDQAAAMLTIALRSTERLTRLVNNLLHIERLTSHGSALELRAVTARSLLVAAADQAAPDAGSMSVVLEVGPAEGQVLADGSQIVQALLHIVGNALRFSDPGSRVRMEARLLGAEVHFQVCDEGRGIPQDKLEAIFERFEQVDSGDARQRGGTGLGLTISRGIVARHGGRIWAESSLGTGTNLHFTLPAAQARRADHDEPAGSTAQDPALASLGTVALR